MSVEPPLICLSMNVSCVLPGIATDVRTPLHLQHIRKLHQCFGMSKAGSMAVRICEKRSEAGVQDSSSTSIFDRALTKFENEDAAMLLQEPAPWLSQGNNGKPQTLVTFAAFLKTVQPLVFI